MINVKIRNPIWYNRSISISSDKVHRAWKSQQALFVEIGAKPYNEAKYTIDPAKVMAIGKKWNIKGRELLNFPISEMEIRRW